MVQPWAELSAVGESGAMPGSSAVDHDNSRETLRDVVDECSRFRCLS